MSACLGASAMAAGGFCSYVGGLCDKKRHILAENWDGNRSNFFLALSWPSNICYILSGWH